MKARIPDAERFRLYDNVIAKDIEAIAETAQYNEKFDETCIGIVYDGSIPSKYVFQMAKIYANCIKVKGTMRIFVKCSKKNFNTLKKENPSLDLTKLNFFNGHRILFAINSTYIEVHNHKLFAKKKNYNENIIEDIWNEYYTNITPIEENSDDVRNLL